MRKKDAWSIMLQDDLENRVVLPKPPKHNEICHWPILPGSRALPGDRRRYRQSLSVHSQGQPGSVISNGTAVLGLGDIGPEASKPVMEGKGLLFKIYADIDVFDIELNCKDVEDFIRTVKAMEPTFGGINLEDIKAPECFEIERRLKAEMNIPVMHDDQHGTAVISGAALLNALERQTETG